MSEVILSLPRSGSTFYMQQRYRERVLNGEQIGFMHEFIWPHSKVRDYHWDNPPRLKSAKQHNTKDFENLIAGIYLSLIHISEPTRRRGISYAVFCLKKKKK